MKKATLEELREIRWKLNALESVPWMDEEWGDLLARRAEIIREILKLPKRQREVLLLYYDGGMTWDRVALSLGIDRRWVYRLGSKNIDK